MASELSREQKKMMQLIALIEKQEEEQKKKNEKKKQQVQNQSTPHSNVLKKSQSVMNPSTNVNGNNGPLIKLKPKVIITFAPGALEQNARYMFSNHIQQSSNKVSVEKSSINWYKWAGDPDRTVQGKRAQREFSNHSERENSPFLRGHQEIFTTARFGRNDSDDKEGGNKRVRTSEGKISIPKSYEDALMLRESQSPDKNLRSQATTQDALVSQNGTTSRQHLLQINSTQFKPPTQVIEEESISLEEQKAALKQEEVVTQMDEETMKILEATSRLQNEMKKRNMHIKPLGDQLFNNISEGKSLRAAILLTAKLKSGQAQTVISRSNQ